MLELAVPRTSRSSGHLERKKMKNNLKVRRWIAVSAIGLLAAVAATSQPERRNRSHQPEPGERLERMERLLDLDQTQVEALEAIFENQRAATEGDREARRANGEALKSALGEANPDPMTVGELVIESKNLRAASKASHEELKGQIAEILTAEQLAKWEGFQRGRGSGQHGPGSKGRRGGPGPRGPGGHGQFGGGPRI